MQPDFKTVLCALACLAGGCNFGSGGGGGAQAGSESHFLERCDPGDCGSGLECVCGVCTRTCMTDDECGDLDGDARCLDVAGGDVVLDCGGSPGVDALCAVSCTRDADCTAVGAKHTCESGVCSAPLALAPTGGSGGASGAGGTGESCGAVTCDAPEVCCACGNFCASPSDGTCPDMCQGTGGTGTGLDCGPEPYDCAQPAHWCTGGCCEGFELRPNTCCPECVPVAGASDCTLECTLREAAGQSVCDCAHEPGSECTNDADCAIAGNWGTCCPACGDAYPRALVEGEECLKTLDEPVPSGCAAQADGCAQGDTKPPASCPDLSCQNAPYAACVAGTCTPTECPEGMVQTLGRCFPGCKTDADCAWATLSTGCCDACPAIYPAQALESVRCVIEAGQPVPGDCRPEASVCAEREANNGPCSPQTCTTPALACQPDGTCAVK